ncbi:MAG: hypothetical protein NT062_26195 [Proteobacteria bacterium]|nr:hypothetical protein [Pseudomonadota bacterium]
MTRRASLAMALSLGLLPLASGCLRFQRLIIEIDVVAHQAAYHFVDVATEDEPDDDAARLIAYAHADDVREVTDVVDAFWTTTVGKRVTATSERIDADLALTFRHLYEIGISSVDAAHPYRFCVPALLDRIPIASTNADARDRRGCVVWSASARLLRIELATTTAPDPVLRARLYARYRELLR